MSNRVMALLLVVLLLLGSSVTEAKAPESPDATKVVARGQRRLANALAIALQKVPQDKGDPLNVGIVVDTTRMLHRWGPYLQRALEEVGETVTSPNWSIAGLGHKFGKSVASAKALAEQVPDVMKLANDVTNTLGALRDTVRSARRKSVIVYLADQHFEDEFELEKFIKDLDRRKCVLSVIGPEAAFSRAWNDGIKNILERGSDYSDPMHSYWADVSRSPFGDEEEKAPRHCGDAACPIAPVRLALFLWTAHFSDTDRSLAASGSKSKSKLPADTDAILRRTLARLKRMRNQSDAIRKQIEELEKRFGPDPSEAKDKPEADPDAPRGIEPSDDVESRDAPIPSGFGPYPLMRAAGHTGGRYVLFVWNRIKGGTPYQLDYARCNLFPPDLRSRKKLLRDLQKSPLSRACFEAWDTLTTTYGDHIVSVTAPLSGKKLKANSMDEVEPLVYMRHDIFDNVAERDAYVKASRKLRSDLHKMRNRIVKHLPEDVVALPATERRWAAEAELFVHILDIAHTKISDELVIAQSIERTAFGGKEKPTINSRTWLRRGRDPENIRRENGDPKPDDEAQELLRERARLLTRYAGTPIGEQIALNSVHMSKPGGFTPSNKPYELPKHGRDRPSSTPPPSGGPGSGGGGPTTGGG